MEIFFVRLAVSFFSYINRSLLSSNVWFLNNEHGISPCCRVEVNMKTFTLLAALIFCPSFATEAHAGGAKPTPEPPPAPVKQEKPYRYVNLAHVTVPTFYFPNGVRADFNADLDKLIETEINNSRFLRTQVATPGHEPRLYITGGVTSLEMDVLQFNIKVGWNQNGPIPMPGVPVASGEIDLRLSSLSMDFKIYDRVTGQSYFSSYTNETLSQLKIEAKVKVSEITASLDVLYKTKMAEALRIATRDIMKNLEANKAFDELPWESKVLGVDAAKNRLVFEGGSSIGVAPDQAYSVYSYCAADDANCFMRFLSDVKVDHVSPISAEAVPLTAKDSVQNIRAGDRVFVKQHVSIEK